jgi:hypothetical protein
MSRLVSVFDGTDYFFQPELSRALPSLASDTSSVTLKSTDFMGDPTSPLVTSPVSPISAQQISLPEEQQNPWLVPREDGASHAGQKKHEVVVGKGSADTDKSRHKMRKRVKKREDEKEKAKDEAAVEISMANVLTLGAAGPSKPQAKGKDKQAPRTQTQEVDGDDEEEVHSEVEEQERLDARGKGRAKGVKAFEQRDLVARAFAGDNVVQDFAEQKRREMQEDAPKEVDTTLPGWVSARRSASLRGGNADRSSPDRARGAARARRRRRQSRTSSRRSRASTRPRARTTTRRTSSSRRSATRRRPSTSSGTCRSRTRARRSSSAAWTRPSARSGTLASVSSVGRCPRSSRRWAPSSRRSRSSSEFLFSNTRTAHCNLFHLSAFSLQCYRAITSGISLSSIHIFIHVPKCRICGISKAVRLSKCCGENGSGGH